MGFLGGPGVSGLRRLATWPRRAVLAVAAALAAVILMTALATGATAQCCDDDEDGIFFDRSEIRLRVLTPEGVFFPEQLALTGPQSAAFAGAPARQAQVVDQDRLNLSGVPVVGGVFGPRALLSFLHNGRRVGRLHRRGAALVVSIDPSLPPDVVARYASGPILLATEPPSKNIPVVVVVDVDLRRVDGGAGAHAGDLGPPIGFAYDADGALLLGPPRERFYAYRLF